MVEHCHGTMQQCPCRLIELAVQAFPVYEWQWRETVIAWIEMLLTTADVQAGEARMLAPGLILPPMDAVLKWGCAILDTHFITLAGLPPKAQQALKALQSQIQEMLQVCILAAPCTFQRTMQATLGCNTQGESESTTCTP